MEPTQRNNSNIRYGVVMPVLLLIYQFSDLILQVPAYFIFVIQMHQFLGNYKIASLK